MDLIPNDPLNDSVSSRVAQDTAFLAAATAFHVKLAKSPFTPGGLLDPATITEADFDTYVPLDGSAAAQTFGFDPLTSQQVIQLSEPAGGWYWQTNGTANMPQTIYGVYITNHADTAILASQLLDTPIVLNAIGQIINLGQLNFRLPLNPLGPA